MITPGTRRALLAAVRDLDPDAQREVIDFARRRARSAAEPPATGWRTVLAVALGVAAIYFVSGIAQGHFDYTFRIAVALLHGRLGLAEPPPSWLNEMVRVGDRHYSVFPLGSVLTVLPAAALQDAGLIASFPARAVAALCGGAIAGGLFLLAGRHGDPLPRRLLLVAAIVLGTWMWCNLMFGGSWHLALGFAVLGQVGALCCVLLRPRPLAAGAWFALAFGNRTEVVLVAPVLVYLLLRGEAVPRGTRVRAVLRFAAVPAALALLTLAYNAARFASPFDFGYARIPGVLQEPWYAHGIFSPRYVPANAVQMLVQGWKTIPAFPYVVPTGFGGSILLASPFLVLLLRRGASDPALVRAAWIAMAALTAVLWVHGNPGGWQFSYRYAMVLLPWMFVVLLETRRGRVTPVEAALVAIAVAVNAYATWLFLRTDYVQP